MLSGVNYLFIEQVYSLIFSLIQLLIQLQYILFIISPKKGIIFFPQYIQNNQIFDQLINIILQSNTSYYNTLHNILKTQSSYPSNPLITIMKTAIIGILALFLQLYKIYKLRKITKYYQMLLKKINTIKTLSIKELKDKIINGAYQVGEYILVQGELISQDRTMCSLLEENKKVAYSELFVNKVIQIGDNNNTIKKRVRRTVSGLLRLVDGKNYINIYQTFKTKFFTSNFVTKTKSYKEKIFKFGWLFSLILKSPTRVVSNIYTEYVIPHRGRVTVLAKIPQSISSQLNLVQPIMISGSKQRIQYYYQGKFQRGMVTMIVMCVLSMITSYILIKLFLIPWLTQTRPLTKKAQLIGVQKIQVLNRNCYRCNNTLSNVINSPCNHLVVCSECNQVEKICVECQKQPKDKIMVYPC